MDQQSIIGFIGAGNMARALIGGLQRSGVSPAQLYATDAKPEVLAAVCLDLQVRPLAETVRPCAALIVAVKPADVRQALHQSSPFIDANTVVLSIAAGIPTRGTRQLAAGRGRAGALHAEPTRPDRRGDQRRVRAAVSQSGATPPGTEHPGGSRRGGLGSMRKTLWTPSLRSPAAARPTCST